MVEFYYFGVKPGDTGHYFYDPKWKSFSYHSFVARLPREFKNFDGGLCPMEREPEGAAIHYQVSGWTVIAFWDRSGDSRPGSNSAFIAHGQFTFEEMLRLAAEHFPAVIARMRVSIFNATI